MNCDCDNLDAYLAGDLVPRDAACFTEHIQVCGNCRDIVEQQQWIDGLLRAAVSDGIDEPSVAILESLRSIAIRPRRKGRIIACGLAAAAMLMVALGWIALSRQAAERAISGVETPKRKPSPHATFVADFNTIAVPVASRYPNVSVVRMYQTLQSRSKSPATGEPEPGTYNKNPWNTTLYGG